VTLPRRLLLALLVVLAVVLQTTVVARLPLPGAAPDLVLVVVVTVGLLEGSRTGMLTGFAAGLLADLSGDAELGRLALVHVAVGHLAGLLQDDARTWRLLPAAVTGALAAVAVLVYAAGGVVLGDPRITGGLLWRSLLSTVPYSAALATVVFPLVGALLRRADRRP
jgi:rod shape-determining protein MreD